MDPNGWLEYFVREMKLLEYFVLGMKLEFEPNSLTWRAARRKP